MRSHVNRQFIREIEKSFSARYPYLKLEFPRDDTHWMTVEVEGIDADKWQRQAQDLLSTEVGLSDELSVGELELRLKNLLNVPVVILRRSGNSYIGTSMTRNWTLKEQNDHGRELTDAPK